MRNNFLDKKEEVCYKSIPFLQITEKGNENMVKLLYFWLEMSENEFVKKKGFNISGENFYKYNHYEKKLSYEKKEGYVKEFWGDGISDLSVIVGANGTGKSTVLSEIIRFNSKGDEGKRIIVYEYNEKVYYMHNLQEKIVTEPFIEYREMEKEEEWETIYGTNSMEQTMYLVEYNNLEVGKYTLNDVTLHKERKKIMEDFKVNQSMKVLEEHIEPGRIANKIRLLNTMSSMEEISKYENVDNIIKLFFLTKSSFGKYGIDREEKIIIRTNNSNSALSNGLIGEENFISSISKNNGENFWETILQSYHNEIGFFYDNRICGDKESIGIEDVKSIRTEMQNILVQNSENNKENSVEKYFLEAADDLILLQRVVEDSIKKWEENGDYFLVVDFFKCEEFFDRIFDIVQQKRASFILRYLSFELEKRASGEEALLKLYSRLYWMFYTKKHKENILLLLDEIDLYMHPQWQRTIVNALIEDVKEIFWGENNVQIIITTHSPIILSDIPKANTIFLKRDGKHCMIDSNENHKETFGNNVHTLFLDSFFLDEKGTMGEFAEKKINNIIKILRRGNAKECEYEKIKETIECVGDGVIKRKLMELYKKKTGEEIKEKKVITLKKDNELVVSLLRNQIKDLEKLINELEEK